MIFSDNFVCECRERSDYSVHIPAPFFRKSIIIEENVKNAEITICGLGFYDLFVNGEKITKGYVAPYISNPDHIAYYDNYNLSDKLKSGENVIAVMLGDGFLNSKTPFWDFKDNVFNSSPKMALLIEIETDNKTITYDASDFVCKKGAIFFNDLRSGVFYDKNLEDRGWKNIGFKEDETWHMPLTADKPRGEAKLCKAEPIVVTKELKPVSITKGELGEYKTISEIPTGKEPPICSTDGYIFDFGENNAGIFRLKIKGTKGQRIDIQCAERLVDGKAHHGNINSMPDGYSQRDIYILNGDGEEIFEPMFTFHGFRYLYVTGLKEEQISPDLLTYLVMSSNLKQTGDFECSDDVVNKIFQAARRSDISNFYYFPMDCPHREKNGWTGDASLSVEHMLYTIDVSNSLKVWLENIRKTQREDGRLPCIIPTGEWGCDWGNGPAWDSVIFNLPYFIYKYTGDTEVIRDNAHMMMSYLEYVSRRRDERGIVEIGLGDWLPVNGTYGYDALLGFTDSTYVYDMCKKAEIMFNAVELKLNAAYAKAFGEEMYDAIRKEYIDTNTMTAADGCQTSQAMGIFYGIFTKEEKPEAVKTFIKRIEKDNKKLTCGCLGTRVFYHVLAQNGYGELAYDMITDDEFPSYAYWINMGKTTMPEQFIIFDHEYIRSENHHFMGDVLQWFMRYLGGINVENCKEVTIRPMFTEKLDYVKCEHILPDGAVKVFWTRGNNGIELSVTCPETVKCNIDVNESVKVIRN